MKVIKSKFRFLQIYHLYLIESISLNFYMYLEMPIALPEIMRELRIGTT